ncbi:hypothetical protein LIER_24008 [Lithospermum erythrorhizon]|uniref:Uncharacterized protein n=1 Tax=Lithospermum erythrorhizon TaxID=34254 RepID=A0AAV3R0Z8_LITER
MDENVPKVWIPLGKANHPKPSATSLTTTQIATLKGLFTKQFEYKVYYEKGTLIHAGLIHDEEFDTTVSPLASWGSGRSGEEDPPPQADPAGQSVSLEKRPTSSGPKKPLFAKKKKKTALPPPLPSEIVDFSEGPILEEPSHTYYGGKNNPPICTGAVQAEGSNSVHVVKRGYSTNYLPLPYTLPGGLVINESSELQRNCEAFMAVKPLMLKQIGQSFDSFRDPLEIDGASMSRVIESMNDSCILACKVHEGLDREKVLKAQLEEARGECSNVEKIVFARDQETKRAEEAEDKMKEVQTTAEALAQQRVQEALENFKDTLEYKLAAGTKVVYCLFEFVKTYKDDTPSLVMNYQEFIQPYPSEWFAALSFDTPSSPEEGGSADPANPANV